MRYKVRVCEDSTTTRRAAATTMSSVSYAEHALRSLWHRLWNVIESLIWNSLDFVLTLVIVGAVAYLTLCVIILLFRMCGAGEHRRRFLSYVGSFAVVVLAVWCALHEIGFSIVEISSVSVVGLILSFGLSDFVGNYAGAVALTFDDKVAIGKPVCVNNGRQPEGLVVDMNTRHVVLFNVSKQSHPGFLNGSAPPDMMPQLDYVPNTDFIRYGFTVPTHSLQAAWNQRSNIGTPDNNAWSGAAQTQQHPVVQAAPRTMAHTPPQGAITIAPQPSNPAAPVMRQRVAPAPTPTRNAALIAANAAAAAATAMDASKRA